MKKIRIRKTSALIAGLSLGMCSTFYGVTLELTPSEDTWISESLSTSDKSTDNTLYTDTVASGSNPDSERNALIKFDLSSIPAGTSIDSATLSLYTDNPSNDPSDLSRIDTPWSDSDTWNTFDTGNGITAANATVLQSIDASADNTYVDVDVTALVQDWIDGTLPNNGFGLDPSDTDMWGFHSAEGANPPVLTVTVSTLELTPSEDTWISESLANTGKGTDTSLYSDTAASSTNPNSERNALIKFDLGSIPTGTQIGTATLSLYTHNPSNDASNLARMNIAWSDSDTWNTFDTGNGITAANATTVQAIDASADDSYVDVDVTALVQDWIDGTLPNNGFGIDPSDTDMWGFHSAEGANPPILRIESALSADYVITAGEDTWIDSNPGTAQHGDATSLRVDNESFDNGGGEMVDRPEQALIRFDLDSIPEGATITSATMVLHTTNSTSGDINIREMIAPWDDTWSWYSWGNDGPEGVWQLDTVGSLVGTITPNANGDIHVDITSMVQEWVDGTAKNYGLLFTGDSTNSWEFDSLEGTNPPTLYVNATGSAPISQGTIVELTAIEDTWISESLANNAYGGDTSLYTDTAASSTNPDSERNMFIRFDVGSIPPGSTIAEANLVLYTDNPSQNPSVCYAIRNTWAWDNSTTWNTFATGSGVWTGINPPIRIRSTVGAGIDESDATVLVTEMVQDWVDGVRPNNGFGFDPTGTDMWRIHSSEGTNPPMLIIELEP